EGGDTGMPPRRNWVEPEPVVFARLAAAADLMRGGLRARRLLTPEAAGLLRTVTGMFRFFERVARGELAARPISTADKRRLTFIGGELESIFWRTADRPATSSPVADSDSAIVADIARSPRGIRELGTGRIDRIYVLVPDDHGRFQVAVGGV